MAVVTTARDLRDSFRGGRLDFLLGHVSGIADAPHGLVPGMADALLALGHIASEFFLHLPLHLLKAGSVLLTTRPEGVVLGFEGVSCALLESIWHRPDAREGLRAVRLEPIF